MAESKTKPVSFRVPVDLLEALEQAGLSASEVAKQAIEREAAKAKRLAALRRLKEAGKGLRLGFDAVEAIRQDRDSGHD